MTATPKYGTMVFQGMVTGQRYSKDVYVSDVAAAAVRWDQGAGAGAATAEEWVVPEPCVLVDYAQVTGTADTEKLQVTRNGVPTGDMLRYGVHLTSLNNRPVLNIPFNAGDRVSGIQIAD